MRRILQMAGGLIMVLPLVALAEEAAGHAEPEPSLFGGDLGNAIWTLVIFFALLVAILATPSGRW